MKLHTPSSYSTPLVFRLSFVTLARSLHPLVPCAAASLASSLLALQARADISLPAMFSDHMVLQSGCAVPVWGTAESNETVTVEFAGQKKTAETDAAGKWTVKLDPLTASAEARELSVTASPKSKVASRKVSDILVGEVWLCSGQSNMGFTVSRANDFDKEKAAANLPKIRMFTVASGTAVEPQENCKGQWAVCTPDSVGAFSAAAYFFGRDLHAKLGVPVGLINSSVGGTEIEAWTSLDAQKNVPEIKPTFDDWDKRIASWNPEAAKAQYEKQRAAWQAAVDAAKAASAAKSAEAAKPTDGAKTAAVPDKPLPREPRPLNDPRLDSNRPANLFNGKIAPLIPFAIKGAIWYQGESNADTVARGYAYRVELPLLIEDWRKRWGTEFPFAWVQLPEYIAHSSDGWCLVREAMLQSLRVPHTGMAVAMGLGDAHDIHPKRKQEVGHRLAEWALNTVYGGKSESSGPVYTGKKIDGGSVTISFSHATALTAIDGDSTASALSPLKGFVISGEDKQWKPATAKISGDKVVVTSPEVPHPVAVRYAWADNPEFNLYNAAGIPASPFRTDDWPIVAK